jgi:hypothetical protein
MNRLSPLHAFREPTPALRRRVQGNVYGTSVRWNRAKQVARYCAAIDAALCEHGENVAAGNVVSAMRPNTTRHQPRFSCLEKR